MIKSKIFISNSKLLKLPQQTNVLIATRDEIMNQIFNKPPKKQIIDEVIDGDYERLQ